MIVVKNDTCNEIMQAVNQKRCWHAFEFYLAIEVLLASISN